MESNILCGTYETKADSSGRVVIPSHLRKERVFYVTFEDKGLDLYPTNNLSDDRLEKLADSRVALDGQNRVNLSQYSHIYDIVGKSIFLLGIGSSINIMTAEDYQKYGILDESQVRSLMDELGI